MTRANFLAGWILVAVAALVFWGALRLPIGRFGSPEAGFVPLIEAILLGLSGLALIIGARNPRGDKPVGWPTGEPKRMIVQLSIAMIGYLTVMPATGFVLATFLFLVATIRAWRKYPIAATVGYAAVITLVIHVTFRMALSMPLPRGFYGLP